MKENIIPFNFDSHAIRVVEVNNEPMFVAKDVAELLGYSNINDAIKRHCEGVVKHDLPTQSGIQSFSLIPEFDVYALVMRSKLDSAKKFRDWVFKVVLPTIRKKGSYQVSPAAPSDVQILEIALRAAKENEALKQQQLIDAPKVAFAEAVNESINSVTIPDFAKSVGYGPNRLYQLLRQNGFLMTGGANQNKPYQRYIDQGIFKLQERTRRDQNGESIVYFITLVTGKGQSYIQSKFFNSPVKEAVCS